MGFDYNKLGIDDRICQPFKIDQIRKPSHVVEQYYFYCKIIVQNIASLKVALPFYSLSLCELGKSSSDTTVLLWTNIHFISLLMALIPVSQGHSPVFYRIMFKVSGLVISKLMH